MKSEWAQAATQIRKKLKKDFPNTKFSVKSEVYSMGSSVNVYYTDGPATHKVRSLIEDYQYGHFDSMRDIYENSNRQDDIPQVKYVMTQREMSKNVREQINCFFEKTDKNFDRNNYIHREYVLKEFHKTDY